MRSISYFLHLSHASTADLNLDSLHRPLPDRVTDSAEVIDPLSHASTAERTIPLIVATNPVAMVA